MRFPVMNSVSGVILSIMPFSGDCCANLVSIRTSNGVVNVVVSRDTYVVDSSRLRQGMMVTAFYNPNLPTPMIFPPQYRAEVIAIRLPEEQVVMEYFDQERVARDGSLKINIDRNTTIVTPNGQRYECNPAGNTLIVFFSSTTRSLPPQTTPRKIVVFC